MASQTSSALTERLIAELAPVRPLQKREGLMMVVAATLLCIAITVPIFGLRPDLLALRPDESVLLRSGALLLIGSASAIAVIASASPSIGARREGWRWALAAGLLFPATSIALMLGGAPFPGSVLVASSAPTCLGVSLSSALLIGAVLTLWLRRGAVTELARAGWLTGLAAGALGAFTYNLGCPSNSVHYAALWFGLAVGVAALAGRVIVPALLRW